MYEGSYFSISSPMLVVFFNTTILVWVVMVLHSGLNVHFCGDWWHWPSFHVPSSTHVILVKFLWTIFHVLK
jgi:hypothetical protein